MLRRSVCAAIVLALPIGCGLALGLDPLAYDTAVDGGDAGIPAPEASVPAPRCGDGVHQSPEICDGLNLADASCASAVAPGWQGAVTCSADCNSIDSSACSSPPTVYRALTDRQFWSSYDLTVLHPGARAFRGGVFDGRFVYLAPFENGIIARYDTREPFEQDGGAGKSWAFRDVTALSTKAKEFVGAVFDGRYVYFSPHRSGAATRFDTQLAFEDNQAWTFFDMSITTPFFYNAAFDGRYVYYLPTNNNGTVARYDTKSGFTDPKAWTSYDLLKRSSLARGFYGGVFDGRYLYLVPYEDQTRGTLARLDTKGDFTSDAAWELHEIVSTEPDGKGFVGGTFDGRYIYFAPHYKNAAYAGDVVRYDTTQLLTAQSAWDRFDLSALNPNAVGFLGAAFDGRHVYFIPLHGPDSYSGTVARFDPTLDFFSPASWSTYQLGSEISTAWRGFAGSVYDGRYLYLVPYLNDTGRHGRVVRFDSKTPSWQPRYWQNTSN